MLDMAVARQLKYKPGKVSAVRDFPLGCGRHAVLLNPVPAKPEELTGSDAGPELPPAQEEALLVARKPEAVELAGAPELPKLQNGGMANGSARVDAGDSNPLQLKAEEGKDVVPVVMLESLESLKEISGQPISVVEQPKEGAAAEMPVYSKIFPPLKRRKISAVRDFPLGCGRNVPYMNGLVQPLVGPITSSECMSKDVEMKPAARPRPMEEGLVGIVSTEKVVGEVISSGAFLVIEKGQHISAEAEFESSEKSVPNSSMVEECSEERVFARSCSEKVGPELTRSDARQIREKIQETSSKSYIMSASKSSSDGYVVEEHHEKKTLLSSVSKKKLGVYDIKSVSKNLQIIQAQGSKPSHPDARSFAAKRVVDKEAMSPTGIAKSLKQSMDLDKKVLEESEEQSLAMVVQSREESFEDYGERLIVQALMAAQNCPWSQGKRSSAVVMQSASPKNKMKKEVKALSKKFSREEASTSKCENKVENKEDEDGMLRDEDNAKVRDVYRRLCDMNVNLTPFGPSTPNQKGGESDDRVTRNKVKKALRLFQVICRKLLQGEEDKSKEFGRIHRVDLTVAAILKENKEWVNTGKPILGNVPGVEVGDEFHYRVELCIVGLHRPFQGGIDFTKIDGMLLATSIVASGGYPGDMDSSDVLIYSGSGGNPSKGKQASHQKLERGNLALKNSIDAKTPVRVIHGFKEPMNSDSRDTRAKCLSTFTYDGLYLVEQYWPELGPHGYNVFKFRLRRMPGQPELALKEVKKSKKSRVREGLCIIDISEGKEKIPICAVNTIDDDRPVLFKYTTKLVYPSWYVQASSVGCDCTDGCCDSEKCACSVKNGGEIPFNFNGAIVQAKPLVYECGPSCKCPPSCHNRVSQNDIKIPLEIFKTKSRGWGVRSLNSIPSGSFICEYVGELLKDTEAEQRSNDEYLFDIGHNYDDHSLWEGLPRSIPGLQSISLCNAAEDVGFTIDAAEYGNVGRFINHSCSPNLYAQNVLYDHDDKRMPHIMFFAADNIPPLQELTYHYNYTVDHVRDSEGNIKRKNCYCGSPECTGRLY